MTLSACTKPRRTLSNSATTPCASPPTSIQACSRMPTAALSFSGARILPPPAHLPPPCTLVSHHTRHLRYQRVGVNILDLLHKSQYKRMLGQWLALSMTTFVSAALSHSCHSCHIRTSMLHTLAQIHLPSAAHISIALTVFGAQSEPRELGRCACVGESVQVLETFVDQWLLHHSEH